MSSANSLLSSSAPAEELEQYFKEDKIPTIVGVVVDSANFAGLSPNKSGDSGHVVSVSRYNPQSNMVRMSNQWGSDNDRWVSVDELKSYMAGGE